MNENEDRWPNLMRRGGSRVLPMYILKVLQRARGEKHEGRETDARGLLRLLRR